MNQQFEMVPEGAVAGVTPRTNRRIVLAARPDGLPDSSTFALEVTALPTPGRGEALVRTLWLSMDPYLLAKMRENTGFGAPFKLNETLQSAGVGEVVESKSSAFKRGDKVYGMLHWADFTVLPAKRLTKLDDKGIPLTAALHVLGMTGLTAYFGMMEIAKPKKGETAVVSAAAGAVGSVAGQIAKIQGCRVIGIVSSEQKARFIKQQLGFNDAITYKTRSVAQALARMCPEGVDIYFDNVGGSITDAVVARIRDGARIVICGQISMYHQQAQEVGPRPYGLLLAHGALMQGFSVYDYEKRHAEGLQQLKRWLRAGKIKYRENVVKGLENAPKAFIGLFKGENIGKQLLKVMADT